MTVQELVDKLREYRGDIVVQVTVRTPKTMVCYFDPVLEVSGNTYEPASATQMSIRVCLLSERLAQ